MEVTEKRLRELERAESKLSYLEAGGVDNWEWYGKSLKPWFEENERDEKMEQLVDDLAATIGEHVEEPAGRGCGHSVTSEGIKEMLKVLYLYKIDFPKDAEK